MNHFQSTPKDRLSYLQKLVTQFCNSNDKELKLKSLANLANFSYDPSNYSYLNQLKPDQLYTEEIGFIEIACGGLCNICLDSTIKENMLNHNAVELLFYCLNKNNESIVKNCLTTLMFLIDDDTYDEICTYELRDYLLELKKSINPCLSNLCNVFLYNYFEGEDN
ncbi:hypothetical protein K502DRAFT_349691 [Neoconidiobolus thromboides FSU 785]|nr:hypothetical protein K502DRAFT_349691 [Neoconidiobolus thromboides FSU 785]